MDNLLDIIYTYTTNNKILDEYAVKNILIQLLKDNKLDTFINYKIVNKKRLDTSFGNKQILGEYDFHDNIFIYLNEINKYINCNKWKTIYHKEYEYNNFYECLAKNMIILETIIHEVHHAKQVAMTQDIYDYSVEKQIVRYEIDYINPYFDIFDLNFIEFYFDYFKRKINYYHCYNISFMERMANNISLNKIKEIIIKLNLDNNFLYDVYKKISITYLLKEYKNNLLGPTIKFMKRIGCTDEFNNSDVFDMIDSMEYNERIKYGLPITEDEYILKKTK